MPCLDWLSSLTQRSVDRDACLQVANDGRKNYWAEGNDYLGINDVYSWPVPVSAFGCAMQRRLKQYSDPTSTDYKDMEGKCGDGGDLIRTIDGVDHYLVRVEVQYHTTCSFRMKEDVTHGFYDIIRVHPDKEPYECETVQAMADQASAVGLEPRSD